MSDVYDLVVSRFTTVFGPPTTDDHDRFVAEYYRALDGTDPELLRAAMDIVLDRQKLPVWPTIGECKLAVLEAVNNRDHARRYSTTAPTEPDRSEPTPEGRAIMQVAMRRMADAAEKREGKTALSALYQEIHGQPYQSSDWLGLTGPEREAKIRAMRDAAEERRLRRFGGAE
jgi:hypothetical protein